MYVILILSIFWSVYGILGLLGFQVIPEEYKGKAWTTKYIRCRGLSWIILGLPWLAVHLIAGYIRANKYVELGILIAIAIPSIIYSFAYEKKYKALLKNEQENELSET